MHILFVTPGYPPFVGGGERYARALALRLAQCGHQVTVLTSDAHAEHDFWTRKTILKEPFEEQDEGIHVIRCAAAGFPGGRAGLLAWRKAMALLSMLPGDQSAPLMSMARHIPALPALESALDNLGEFDLVHGFNLSWEHALMAGWRFARQRALPFFVAPFTHLGAEKHDRVARNCTMDHQRRILADAAAVLTLTSVEREGLIALGLRPERVHVVGAGLDPLPGSAGDAEASAHILERRGLQPPLILFIGRASRDKGALVAAEAVRSLLRRGVRVTLVLVGQLSPEFSRYYRRLSAAERQFIRSLGIVDEVSKHALLEASAMLVLPSHTDSFGLVLLEAWAHGKPVIGARAGGIPGVIDEGANGLLVPYGDVSELAQTIERLLRDEPLALRCGQRGREKVASQYSWDHVCGQVLAAYHMALGR
jgi:glycosyltransferase involved in cell wall biosynthesis